MKLFSNAAAMALGLALLAADAGVLAIKGPAQAKATGTQWLAAGWVRRDGPAPQVRLGLLIRFDRAAASAPLPSHPHPEASH